MLMAATAVVSLPLSTKDLAGRRCARTYATHTWVLEINRNLVFAGLLELPVARKRGYTLLGQGL